jgi:hypothetical protein
VSGSGSLIFAAPVFFGSSDQGLRADSRGNQAIWFRQAGDADVRLLATNLDGRVVPIALSPDGQVAAVWWLPEDRTEDDLPCTQGVYLLSTDGGSSRLVASGDASWVDSDGEVRYRIPEAGFSSDGRWLAVVARERITIVDVEAEEPPIQHVGSCQSWAWEPAKAWFVAGCDDMTTAWAVAPYAANGAGSIALPLPSGGGFSCADNSPWGQSIGLTKAGGIRVVRFFANPAGSCSDGAMRYAVTTWTWPNWTTRWGIVDFALDGGFDDAGQYTLTTRLSAGATWVYAAYVLNPPNNARVVNLATGEVRSIARIGEPVGAPADSKAMYAARANADNRSVIIWSLSGAGVRRQVATIAWPEGMAPGPIGSIPSVIPVFGVQYVPS